ncbi:PaaI family thioesterase [Pseudoflavonifractor sp. MSJ-37]|uniref:PaaI family thioesterase n=1 Tax=Pseudoflavonifractor sp. MSJ-37 TaxID=2841531 RepID=UPI001C0F7B1A|nr:PaaI family thioesterase [Pseudoflavonifractor sp. MSJ-37]MBU5436090.1 PaaI family thioesterase [Pseudoflavonifractor sp. MSJ-37]
MDSYSNLEARAKCNRFGEHNGIVMTKIEQDYAEGEITVCETHLNPMGMVHGGCLATLADSVTGTAVATRGRVGVTMDCRMDYLRPAVGTKKVRCRAIPQKIGRTITLYRAELTNDDGALIAVGTFSFFLTDKPLPNFQELLDQARAHQEAQGDA